MMIWGYYRTKKCLLVNDYYKKYDYKRKRDIVTMIPKGCKKIVKDYVKLDMNECSWKRRFREERQDLIIEKAKYLRPITDAIRAICYINVNPGKSSYKIDIDDIIPMFLKPSNTKKIVFEQISSLPDYGKILRSEIYFKYIVPIHQRTETPTLEVTLYKHRLFCVCNYTHKRKIISRKDDLIRIIKCYNLRLPKPYWDENDFIEYTIYDKNHIDIVYSQSLMKKMMSIDDL